MRLPNPRLSLTEFREPRRGDIASVDMLDMPYAAPPGLGFWGAGDLGFGSLTPGYLMSRSALLPLPPDGRGLDRT